MRKYRMLLLLAMLAGGGAIAESGVQAPADSYRLEAATLAGGGGTSSARSACFKLTATLAQPVAGTSSSQDFSLTSGFWATPPPIPHDDIFADSFEDCRS